MGSSVGAGGSKTDVNSAGQEDGNDVPVKGRSLEVTHPSVAGRLVAGRLEAVDATQKPDESRDYFKLVLERVRDEPKWRTNA
jgi:hypothetical protein